MTIAGCARCLSTVSVRHGEALDLDDLDESSRARFKPELRRVEGEG